MIATSKLVSVITNSKGESSPNEAALAALDYNQAGNNAQANAVYDVLLPIAGAELAVEIADYSS